MSTLYTHEKTRKQTKESHADVFTFTVPRWLFFTYGIFWPNQPKHKLLCRNLNEKNKINFTSYFLFPMDRNCKSTKYRRN